MGRSPSRRTARRALVPVFLAVAIVAGGAAAILTRLEAQGPSSARAALVDQLSATAPNPAFVASATDILQRAGYTVDYYSGEQVTVDFYRRLPTLRYGMLILRVHSARFKEADGTLSDEVGLFTNEPHSQRKYPREREAGLIAQARYLLEDPPQNLFSITDGFVQSAMEGNFEGATVIMMGCSGLRSDKLAKALVQKGARAIVGWDGEVAASYTDSTSELLLRYLVTDRLSVRQAVNETMAQTGPDPWYGGRLVAYPF